MQEFLQLQQMAKSIEGIPKNESVPELFRVAGRFREQHSPKCCSFSA
jgi:hypothetical protein